MRFKIFVLTVATLVLSCVPDPTAPSTSTEPLKPGGFYVLCEGLWSQDNATLSYISPTGSVVRDVVSAYNAGTKLGDTGTDIVVLGDTIVVAVSSSHSVCFVNRKDGAFIGRLSMLDGKEPYRLAASSSGKVYCTNINDDSITELDALTLTITVPRVVVGPAPEGVACADGKVYVANGGYGDLRKHEAGAGTISVLSQFDLSTVATITDLPNVGHVCADQQRHLVWAAYRHFASQPDSLGGVVLIDSRKDTVMGSWRLKNPAGLIVDESTGVLYVLHEDGIDAIDNTTQTTRRIISHHSGDGSDVWYSIGFDSTNRTLLIGNARSYVTDGEVIEYDLNGVLIQRFAVGLNPTAFTSR